MPSDAPHLLARFQKMPSVSAGKNAAAAKENAADTRNRMSAGFCAATGRPPEGHDQQQDLGDGHAACRGGVRVDHLVVQVVAERVGDGQQQAVGGGQRRGQAAGGHHARDHVGQAADFRRRQHDDVAADRHLVELQDAVAC
jgi:hypothetical protein